MGKNGRTFFDRPKLTAGCSANGRRRRREEEGGGGGEEEEEEETLEVLCIVRRRPLRQTDPSSGGVLPSLCDTECDQV